MAAFYSIINLPLDEHGAHRARIAGWLVPAAGIDRHRGAGAVDRRRDRLARRSGARAYYSHGAAEHHRAWFAEAGLEARRAGREPRTGNPGYAMLLARRAGTEG